MATPAESDRFAIDLVAQRLSRLISGLASECVAGRNRHDVGMSCSSLSVLVQPSSPPHKCCGSAISLAGSELICDERPSRLSLVTVLDALVADALKE